MGGADLRWQVALRRERPVLDGPTRRQLADLALTLTRTCSASATGPTRPLLPGGSSGANCCKHPVPHVTSLASWRCRGGSAPVGGRKERESAADERGLAGAVLDERLHADRPVLRREQPGEQRRLEPQRGVEVHLEALVDRLLRG